MGIKKIEWEALDWINLTEDDSDKCGGGGVALNTVIIFQVP